MKKAIIFLLFAFLTLLSGCLVSSIHPFFRDKDIVFDPVMTGKWLDGDSSLWVIEPNMASEGFMEPESPDQKYSITYFEEPDRSGKFIGTLFRINGVQYVDFYPDTDEDNCVTELTCWHHFPTHTLARVQFNSDSILLYWFGEEWLSDMLEENRIRIKHETVDLGNNYTRRVLTASTDELQKFIRKYANDPKTMEEINAIFARGYTEDDEEYGMFLKLKPVN
jgi:hypothetical protein